MSNEIEQKMVLVQHDPERAPTMYVEIDGAIEERPVAYLAAPNIMADGTILDKLSRAYPVLAENEQAVWEIGSSLPKIIKVRE